MRLALAGLLALIAVGCKSAPPPPPSGGETAATTSDTAPLSSARRVRFQLVETARIETASRVELWLPIASNEAGLQEIEKLDVSVTPSAPHEITTDRYGNRVLHVKAGTALTVTVTYRVLRTELRADLSKAESRPLTEAESEALAAELRETDDPELAEHRRAGRPARRALGARVQGFEEGPALFPHNWVEVYEPGLGWVPFGRLDDGTPASVLPGDVLLIARGSRSALPFASVDGVKTWVYAAFKGQLLEAP